MRILRLVIGIVDWCLALATAAIVAIYGLAAFEIEEREDVLALFLTITVGGALCALFSTVAWNLMRRKSRSASKVLRVASLFGAIVLCAVGIAGFLFVNPRSIESGLVWLPGLALALSAFALGQPDQETRSPRNIVS